MLRCALPFAESPAPLPTNLSPVNTFGECFIPLMEVAVFRDTILLIENKLADTESRLFARETFSNERAKQLMRQTTLQSFENCKLALEVC